jgi:hypothetical protein
MRLALLLCSVALLATPAIADEVVASKGGDSVRLSDSQCSSDKVLEHVPPQFRPQMKDAVAMVGGQPFKACWAVGGGMAHLVYEDGDHGMVPLSEFRKPG